MRWWLATWLLVLAGPARAEGYLGWGLGYNSAQGTLQNALQVFVGLDVGKTGAVGAAMEAGYLDTSDTALDGGWGAVLFRVDMAEQTELLIRAGVDWGDDAGSLAGIGVGYRLEQNMWVRAELAARATGSSLMFNVAWTP